MKVLMKTSFSRLAKLPDIPTKSTSTTIEPSPLGNKKEEGDQVVDHKERLEPVLPNEPVALKPAKDVKAATQTPPPKSLAEVKQQEILGQPQNSLDES